MHVFSNPGRIRHSANRRRWRLHRHIAHRDGLVCGPHIGGCGASLDLAVKDPFERGFATVDHIIPKDFYPALPSLPSHLMGMPWNIQLMCKPCNEQKANSMFGFPIFNCTCHAVLINPSDSIAWLLTKCDTKTGDWAHEELLEDAILRKPYEWRSIPAPFRIRDSGRDYTSKFTPIGQLLDISLGFSKPDDNQGTALHAVSLPSAEFRNTWVIVHLSRGDPSIGDKFPIGEWVPVLDQFKSNVRVVMAYKHIELTWNQGGAVTRTLRLQPAKMDWTDPDTGGQLHMGEFGVWTMY